MDERVGGRSFNGAVLERLVTSFLRRGGQTWHTSTSFHASTSQSSPLKAIQLVVLGAITTVPSDPTIFDSDPLFELGTVLTAQAYPPFVHLWIFLMGGWTTSTHAHRHVSATQYQLNKMLAAALNKRLT
ncbi:hypothetical protein EDB89DRAFT_2075897 [Lactarius sanguifluus]|nr:hypothetical protein EDB89DRAFT_2075897 [Lactarius sanguifluus]